MASAARAPARASWPAGGRGRRRQAGAAPGSAAHALAPWLWNWPMRSPCSTTTRLQSHVRSTSRRGASSATSRYLAAERGMHGAVQGLSTGRDALAVSRDRAACHFQGCAKLQWQSRWCQCSRRRPPRLRCPRTWHTAKAPGASATAPARSHPPCRPLPAAHWAAPRPCPRACTTGCRSRAQPPARVALPPRLRQLLARHCCLLPSRLLQAAQRPRPARRLHAAPAAQDKGGQLSCGTGRGLQARRCSRNARAALLGWGLAARRPRAGCSRLGGHVSTLATHLAHNLKPPSAASPNLPIAAAIAAARLHQAQ